MRRWNIWIMVLIVIGCIFYLSSIPGLRVLPVLRQLNSFISGFDVYFIRIAQEISQRLPMDTNELNPIRTVSKDFYAYAKENPIILEFLLRKMAHVFVFFCLTLTVFLLTNQYTKKSISAAFLAFLITTLFAALDEFHQSFVDGRVSSFIDVGIDMIGIIMATFVIGFSIFITKKWSGKESPIK